MNKILNVLCLFLICTQANSQETGEEQLGTWLLLNGTHQISAKFSVYTEIQLNYYEVLSNYQQFWTLNGLNYHWTDRVQVTVGYGYFNTDPTFEESAERNIYESRIFEQFSHNIPFGKLQFQHRYRLEQRFINNNELSHTRHRMRYRLKLTHPISSKWFVNVFNELFLNLQEPTFDQNRLFMATGYKISDTIKLEAGYLKLHFTRKSLDRIQLVFTVNTDLRKKETKTTEK